MTIKVGINGFGRIGRMVFRAISKDFPGIEVVGINDLLDPEYLAYMLKYDSVHGRFNGEISVDGNNMVVNGKKTSLTAEVYFPDSQAESGHATREYIRPGAEGSRARAQKKTEYLLTRMGYLPTGWVTTPGRYIMEGKLDGFGNMPGSYYKQIIRNLGIKNTKGPPKPVSGASQRRAARMAVPNEFFAVKTGTNSLAKGGGWLPPGVYKREGKGGSTLRQYLKFVKKASYKQRLNVLAEVQTAVTTHLQTRWNESVKEITDRFNAH